MKLTAEIAGETYELNIVRDGQCVVAEIAGRRYELQARMSAPGVYLLLAENKVYECRVSRDAVRREKLDVLIGAGSAYTVALNDPKRLRSAIGLRAHAGDASAQIVAPMPGKVVRVLVEAGAKVEAGQGLIVVEAMKMQNEMKAPRDGIVKTLHAKAGANVNAGDVLAVVE